MCALAPVAQAQTKVQIGIVTALTGPMAAPGVFQMNGFKLAAEDAAEERILDVLVPPSREIGFASSASDAENATRQKFRKMLREGADVLVISSGFMTMRTLEVAKQLEADKVNVAVLHCPTIKPLDDATILAEVRKPGRLVVVAENHSIVGGLGEAVASLLMREGVMPAKFRMLGLPDAFLDAGALPTLHDRYGISAEKVAASLKAWLA